MTTEGNTQTPPATPPAEAPKAAPSVDVEKIVNDRIKNVQKDVQAQVTNNIIRSLGGGEEKGEDPIHTAIINQPKEFVDRIVEVATEKAVSTVTAAMGVRDESARAFNAVADEYPDLKKVKNEVLVEFSSMDTNRSVGDRMTEASKKVVERMGWKSKTESRTEQSVIDASMSPGGYQPSQEAIQKLPSTGKSFIQQRKEQFAKITNKTAPKAA